MGTNEKNTQENRYIDVRQVFEDIELPIEQIENDLLNISK